MAKYRVLSSEELYELEKEFIDFLVLNGIPADDWIKIKKEPSKANRMIELFSDVVFEKILRDIKYLDHFSQFSIKSFFCDKNTIHLIGVDSEDPDMDFRNIESAKTSILSNSGQIKIYNTSKSYKGSREKELFQMLQNGCQKSDGQLFELLKSAI